MFRCMYIAPVASLQHTLSKTVVSPDRDPAEDQTKNLPFLIDPNHVKSLQYTPDECGGVTVIYNSSSTGYFIGQTPLTCGKYSWKVRYQSPLIRGYCSGFVLYPLLLISDKGLLLLTFLFM